ncbi:YrhC family protein [Pseudalkalibacillus sp. R45]|uniref:YrhC family protein n=1 Tax=Pseudalkalibacillus sp. R45 TaxID=3457433 RepID=UPI003FCD3092
MSKEMVKDTKDKIADFKRFSFVLLSLSVFLYIGSIIPFEGKQTLHQLILLGTSYLSIGIALVFYRKISQWKKQLNEKS